MNIFVNEGADLLVQALLSLKTAEECKAFLEDLMTTKELLDMSQRMQVASLLRDGKVYSKIAELTGASTATISRVNHCYAYGNDGYKAVFEKIKKKGE